MSMMVGMSVILTFIQEFRSNRAAEKLEKMVRTTATVIRQFSQNIMTSEVISNSQKMEIPISEIVPGDLVTLSAGDMIPANIRLLTSKDLFVSQSAMTGESLPVEKFADEDPNQINDLPLLRNICFMGSNVISGTATGVVLKIGKETYLGSISKSLVTVREQTSF